MTVVIAVMAAAILAAVSVAIALYVRLRRLERKMLTRLDWMTAERRAYAAFLRILSDDFVERLSAIHGHADLLLGDWRGKLMPAQADSVKRIHATTRALSSLASDAAIVSIIEAGEAKFHFETISIAAGVEPLVNEYRLMAAECGQRIHLALSAEAETLFIDPPWFARVVRCVMGSVVRLAAPGSSIFVTGKRVVMPPTASTSERECFCLSFSMTSSLVTANDLMPVLGEKIDCRKLAPAGASRLLAARRIAQALGGDISVAGRSTNPIVQVTIARS